ncbi:Threonine/homoserine/homoserine lactone efflux protein [Jannaschia faecimaris]|uniref:Threonine/homoserine/homoserine lactone efflux protein n=1 Tax=Jannaschia faecimaris TaxID=1244108 RepID=A0A1H3RBN8_9RHOB|nr:LysE family translocator [Jannaschia faecimaris]SDZ23232.1 Threonine/homoserine/homoserine lactone efflux protein [Jannaschia faecimaris]
MTFEALLAFALIATLLVISPGPNGVLIARTVPTSGRAVGFANVAGFVAAFYLHGALAILGVSVILTQSAQAFTVVKIAGAAYLAWVGLKAVRTAIRGDAAQASVTPAARRRTLWRAFREGFLTNALNPKVAIFYLAAFPQFIPAGGSAGSAMSLVVVHSLINLAWFSLMILALGRVLGLARSGPVQRWIKGVTGIVFIGFGAKLATTRL